MDARLETREGVDRLCVGAPLAWRSSLGEVPDNGSGAGQGNADTQGFEAEPTDAVDRAGIFSLRSIESKQPARQLILGVRPRATDYFTQGEIR